MGPHRTGWHFFFAVLLRKRGPRWIEVRDEVPLSGEPLRLDYLLLHRRPEIPDDDPGQTLLGLWPLLPPTTIVELKTVGRPYRRRNLDRLLGYLHVYYSADDGGDEPVPAPAEATETPSGRRLRRPRAVEHHADLAGLLVVPARTPTLDRDVAERGLVWNGLGAGYAELTGGLFRVLVAEIDVVADHDDDDMVRLFGREREHTLAARRFWAEQVGTKEAMMAVHDLEDYDEVFRRFLDLLQPEDRLIGLTPEQVPRALAGLAPEQLLLALPDDMLRTFGDSILDKLPEPARSALRKRLAR